MLEACFADLLKGLVFDDEVMDWIVDALHQSHADEKKFRRDAIARLQDEQSKLQNRLDKLYDDRLDGFIEPDFFERKAREWRQTQKRLTDQIAEYENAAHDYVQDGVRLLELAKKAYFLFKQQNSSEKRKLLNFVCSNSTWKDQTLTATFRQPFDLLALTNTTWQRKKAGGGTCRLEPILCRDWKQLIAASSIKTERFRISTLSTIRVLEPLNCRKCKLELKHCRKCNSERNGRSAVVRMR